MKTKLSIILGALAIIGITSFIACEKSDVTPSQGTTGVLDKKGNNPNSPGYNPCAWLSQYTSVNLPQENWGITVDTSVCGFVILRWAPQAKYVAGSDGCSSVGVYYVATTPWSPNAGTGSPCAGNITSTNSYYYQLGSGCSMWPGQEYRINLSYLEKDTVAKQFKWHYSETVQFFTGTRATFLGTCP